jgi:hypothetical protein
MTSTIDRRDDAGTVDLTYFTQPPALRRPDATGEHPVYRPGGLVDRPAGLAELARLSAGETLVLPVEAVPYPAPPVIAAVYPARHAALPERPDGYRGRRRRPVPGWAMLLIGAGVILIAEATSALTMIAVFS